MHKGIFFDLITKLIGNKESCFILLFFSSIHMVNLVLRCVLCPVHRHTLAGNHFSGSCLHEIQRYVLRTIKWFIACPFSVYSITLYTF